jgi:non-specific serine/threonine protein kinase/serine/threonine-protein kinase
MIERENIIDDLFAQAVELEEDDRQAFLAEASAKHKTLAGEGVINEVAQLLRDYQSAEQEGFLQQPLVSEESAHTLAEGQEFEGYRILRLIGEGGMGEVYLAEDVELNRKVAIKLIKSHLKTRELLRRFRNERQILANLQHPNIAKLFQAGASRDGLPFFVMEYVEGRPIDQYADEEKLSVAARLKLFRAVCSAVSYAHQNLVVHRDIKPSNILVSGDGTPKLLDFGIAKLLHESEQQDATTTLLRVMTPEYASPEQVKGEPITTATDVYSLGVLLYELLTGQRPYKLKGRTLDEVSKAICEQEPLRPSTAASERMRDEGGRMKTGSAALPPSSLIPHPSVLRGDLDNIVLMALRKEPQRRYVTVEQFSEDLRRHLEGLPVSARKDTLSYRTAKFIQRNKVGVAAAALAVVAVIGGLVATLWEARVAKAQRGRAERRFNDVRKLAHSVLFDYHDAIAPLPGSTQVRERLVKDSLEYLDSLAKEVGNDLSLQRELAGAYLRVAEVQGSAAAQTTGGSLTFSNLGDTAGALASNRKALAICERLAALAPSDREIRIDLATSLTRMGQTSITLGKPAEAADYYRKAVAIGEEVVAADPTNKTLRFRLGTTYFGLASALGIPTNANLGDIKGALEYMRKGLAIAEEMTAADPADTTYRKSLASFYSAMAQLLQASGDQKGAVDYEWKVLAIEEALVRENGTNAFYRRELAITYGNVGVDLLHAGDKAGALEKFRQALALYESLAAADPKDADIHRDLAVGYRNLGATLAQLNDRAGSLENFRKAMRVFEELTAKDPTNAFLRRHQAFTYLRMSMALSGFGDATAAIDNVRQAIKICEALVAANPKNASASNTLALSYTQLGKFYTSLASKAGIAAGKQTEQWHEAKASFQKALSIYQDMKNQNTLNATDASKPDEIAKEIAKCDAALPKLQ